jgi:hypothetical protein
MKTTLFAAFLGSGHLWWGIGLGDIKKIISRLLSRKLSRYSTISR